MFETTAAAVKLQTPYLQLSMQKRILLLTGIANFDNIKLEIFNCLVESSMPRDKTATHVKLMAAARREFLEVGFEKASMRSIGERCGMTAAGLYRHCRDKEDLFD